MYLPSHFAEHDRDVIVRLIAERPLATVVTLDEEGLHADHIPLLLEAADGGFGKLIGHVARNSHLWQRSGQALAIFQGASAYISPSWYQTKRESHEVVPTYNYAVVHCHGNLEVHDDPKWVRRVVGKLTQRMESELARPWRMGEAPAPFLERQIANIVGISMDVERVEAKWKTSQNRVGADRQGAISGLRARGGDDGEAMARLIERTLERP